MAAALDAVVVGRGAPQSITVDNGTEFASKAMDNDGDETALENAARCPHFPRTAAAARDRICAPVSSLLLETGA